ncbi:MAG: hypothetical protein K2Q22_16320 [Cytophagales bacterium]|nr:hypothetical protein [Cytophagales bacterium]
MYFKVYKNQIFKVIYNAEKTVAYRVWSKGENSLSAGLDPGIYYLVTPRKVQKMVVY